MSKIHPLPLKLQNQIAAGEVVERPASVVKELIENALDAGATTIDVILHQAGRALITVTDNGEGMSAEDAQIAFERHTTSKILEEPDLWSVQTLGFRGEALAAIASVSRVRLHTCRPGDQTGTEIRMEGSVRTRAAEATPIAGTSIEVRDLFFNTPARRKFLKTDATELHHTIETITLHALGRPDVAFTLTHNDKRLLELPRCTGIEDRIRDLFGKEFAGRLRSVSPIRRQGIRVEGFVSLDHGSTRRLQHLLINRRPVKHPMVSQAVYQATDPRRPEHRHPLFILFIDLDPSLVDVNVHPTKREVRFADPQAVHAALAEALRGLDKPFEPVPENAPRSDHVNPPWETSDVTGSCSAPAIVAHRASLAAEQTSLYHTLAPSNETPRPRPFIRFGRTYFAYADGQGLILVDQHAAHERVLYEKLLSRTDRSSAPLLVPHPIEVQTAEEEILLAHRESLAELGIAFDSFGPRRLVIRAVPPEFPGIDIGGMLRDIAAHLMEERQLDRESLRKDLAARLACHEAVRSGDALTDTATEALLTQLESCAEPDRCPHGRPTRLKWEASDLDRLFKRT